jgi:PAS domain S-box-containing protein
MKNLKLYAAYLRDHHLLEFSKEYILLVQTQKIPIMRMFTGISDQELLHQAMDSNARFFSSLVDDTVLTRARETLRAWEANQLPGISRKDVQPSDLILVYAAQRRMMQQFLPAYTPESAAAISILEELELYYTAVQEEAVKLLFKIQAETENQLRESEERYRDLFENTSDLIHILDKENNISYANKSWLNNMGYTLEEVKQAPISRFIHPRSLTTYNEARAMAIEERKTEAIETVFITRSGEHILLDGTINCKWNGNSLLLLRGIFRNVTRKKSIEQELAAKTRELMRSNSELEQFAYVASHDLQEPLRMITSYIQLLARRYTDKLDQDANDFIHYAIDGSNRMRTLINSLLEYSRVNRIKPFENVDVSELLKEVQTDLHELITENEASIILGQMPVLHCDTVLLGLLFQNLIGNAIKFKSADQPLIHITAEKMGDHQLFRIRDNGIGIQQEYFKKIFIIFQRLNGKEDYPGTGIGLAICKKIVERHGGEIWVESEPGKGSVFCFTLAG